jgi:hypothetical protein
VSVRRGEERDDARVDGTSAMKEEGVSEAALAGERRGEEGDGDGGARRRGYADGI